MVATVVAAAGQAVAGLGFSLVALPFISIAAGPDAAVPTINLVAASLNVAMLLHERRGVRWSDALRLFVPAAIVIPVVGVAVERLPTDALSMINGAAILTAAALLAAGVRAPSLRGRRGAVLAGATSGAMNVATSVGGPPAAMYAVNADWPAASYRPTLQAYFLGINLVSFAVRGAPTLDEPALIAQLFVATIAGWLVGRSVASRVDDDLVRNLLLLIAAGGGVVALVRGALGG